MLPLKPPPRRLRRNHKRRHNDHNARQRSQRRRKTAIIRESIVGEVGNGESHSCAAEKAFGAAYGDGVLIVLNVLFADDLYVHGCLSVVSQRHVS